MVAGAGIEPAASRLSSERSCLYELAGGGPQPAIRTQRPLILSQRGMPVPFSWGCLVVRPPGLDPGRLAAAGFEPAASADSAKSAACVLVREVRVERTDHEVLGHAALPVCVLAHRLVPAGGFDPPRPCGRQALDLVRLPVPPRRH